MNRRRLLIAGLAVACAPLSRHAGAQAEPRRVGVLVQSRTGDADMVRILVERLGRAGLVEGRNLKLHVESVEVDEARYAECARRLVEAKPEVLYATTEPLVDALRTGAGTVPLIFNSVPDPVRRGYVRELARPGGNLTGVTDRYVEMGVKRLELLRELAPRARRVAFVASDDDTLGFETWRAAARGLGFDVLEVNAPRQGVALEAALGQALARGADCLLPIALLRDPGKPGTSALTTFLDFVARKRIPAVYSSTPVVLRRGGLISLEIDAADAMQQGAEMVVRVLRGEKPGSMPVQEPDRFALAVNLRAAKEQGVAIPRSILLRATQVAE